MRTKVTNAQTGYNQAHSGSAIVGILVRNGGDPANADNIIARASTINWNIPFGISDVPELGTRTAKETVYGRQNLISGRFGLVMTFKNNDQLTTSETMKEDDAGMTLFVLTGEDHPLTTAPDGSAQPIITDVFEGVKISNESGGVQVNQTRMTDVQWIATNHKTGAEWKKSNASARYIADVA